MNYMKNRNFGSKNLNQNFSGVLDIQAFERLLGPCKELLERNIDLYAAELKEILSKDAEEE